MFVGLVVTIQRGDAVLFPSNPFICFTVLVLELFLRSTPELLHSPFSCYLLFHPYGKPQVVQEVSLGDNLFILKS